MAFYPGVNQTDVGEFPCLFVSHHHRMILPFNSSPPGQNGRHFGRQQFQMHFLALKFEFWLKFHWSLFVSVQLTIPSIGSDNGLAPNRRQAIIWTNADPIYWRIYAALRGDEFMLVSGLIYIVNSGLRNKLYPEAYRLVNCLWNHISTSAFAVVSYLMADVETNFFL